MGAAIGQALPYAIGVAISPIPMIAVVLLLSSKRGGANGIAYLAGAAIGLAAIGAVVLLLAGDSATDASGEASSSTKTIDLAVGALLIVLAARSWRKRPPKGQETELPKWMSTLDHFTPAKSIVLAMALAVINFKNLLLTIGGATAIAQATTDGRDETVALAVFVLVGILGPAIPVVIYFATGEKADAKLLAMKHWLAQNSNVIMAIVLLAIGIKILIDGLTG